MSSASFWQFIGGLGLLLFSMRQLESGLKALGGRSLVDFLGRSTSSPIRGIIGGFTVTALLQSSSLVGLIVLAFVGAGLMSLQNALGVIIGSNLGTTLTGWIVATLGFKLDTAGLAFPLIGAGALAHLAGSGRTSVIGRVVLGLGLLLLSLTLMKDSVAELQTAVTVEQLSGLPAWQYLLFGLVFAAVIQSSSATMVINLAALNAGIIELPSAAAVAIGADLGTTTTVLLGAVQGTASKRRVAMAHFLFNLITDVLAFVFRMPLLGIVAAVGIDDPLLSLVAFHSLFNLAGILLFLPFLGLFARFLEGLFSHHDRPASRFVSEVAPEISPAAVEAMTRETAHLIGRVIAQNQRVFDPPLPLPPGQMPVEVDTSMLEDSEGAFETMYRGTKRLEGEILRFAARLQSQPLDEDQSEALSQLISATRYAVHAGKSLKDIRHNLDEFSASPRPSMRRYIDHFRSVMSAFYADLFQLREHGEKHVPVEELMELINRIQEWHDDLHREIYADISTGAVAEAETSSLLNVNREVLNANMALMMALRDFHLEPEQARTITQLPGLT